MRRALGRYTLYTAIGGGGMATVHLGRLAGPVGFGRMVAIKQMHRDYARDPDFVAMFVDEARLAARVHHPNVVQTLDVVVDGSDLFLIMEYVRGAPLNHLMGEGAPPAIAASIICGVLHGLHAAHEATDANGEPLDIVHRDVSPQNVLVGCDGIARLADFGIAKASGQAHTTHDGQIKGKFSYMAPEQVTNVLVTRQSDVFAASIVFWELLTGTRLFRAETERDVLARVMVLPIDPPSTLAKGITPSLDAIVLRGLARDVQTRFKSAEDMAREIERTVPLAPQSEVAEWVSRKAEVEIAARAELVAAIESGAHDVASDEADSSAGTRTLAARTPDGERTELSSSSPAAHRASRRALSALVAVLVLGLGTYVTVRTYKVQRPVPREPETALAPVAASTYVAPAVVETLYGIVEPPASNNPQPPVHSIATNRPVVKPPPPPPSSTVDCTTPSYRTPDGRTHYKPECLSHSP